MRRRRRRRSRMPAALRRYWARHRRPRSLGAAARRRRRHGFRVSGYHALRGRVRVRRRTFTLRKRSRFKRALRGYRINPYVAEYLMNPRRRRHGRYRGNPASGVMRAVTGTFDMRTIQQGAIATSGALLTITVGNLALSYLAPYAPASIQTGYLGIAAKAAVRSGVAWALDRYVVGMISRDHTAFRVGAGIGIFGSAILEVLGRSLIIGQGDASQSIQSFVPVSMGGLNVYTRGGALTRGTNVSGYVRGGRVGVGALNIGSGVQLGNEAHQRLYGYGS